MFKASLYELAWGLTKALGVEVDIGNFETKARITNS